jgi:hypothetical protein
VVGWLYFFGMVCFVPMTMSGVGYLAANLLGINPDWWILFFFLGLALFVVLSVVRIKVTTRTQLVVGIATVALIVLVDLITTAKGGSQGPSAESERVSVARSLQQLGCRSRALWAGRATTAVCNGPASERGRGLAWHPVRRPVS